MNKKNKKVGTMMAVGAGLAAATIGAYLLFGPKGKKNRKAVRGWLIKMKGEIIEQLEKVQHVTEPVFNQVIQAVAARYEKAKNVDKKELEQALAEMRRHWKTIAKGASVKSKKK